MEKGTSDIFEEIDRIALFKNETKKKRQSIIIYNAFIILLLLAALIMMTYKGLSNYSSGGIISRIIFLLVCIFYLRMFTQLKRNSWYGLLIIDILSTILFSFMIISFVKENNFDDDSNVFAVVLMVALIAWSIKILLCFKDRGIRSLFNIP